MDFFEESRLNSGLESQNPERAIVGLFSNCNSINDLNLAYIGYKGIIQKSNDQTLDELTLDVRIRALGRYGRRLIEMGKFDNHNERHKLLLAEMRLFLYNSDVLISLSDDEKSMVEDIIDWFGMTKKEIQHSAEDDVTPPGVGGLSGMLS